MDTHRRTVQSAFVRACRAAVQNGRHCPASALVVGRADQQIARDHAIFGEIACDHRDGGWGSGEGLVDYTLYYYARCSKPLKGGVVTGAPSNTVFRMEFPTQEGEEVRLDVWISYESVQKARALSRMRREPQIDPWAPVFDKIDVKGGTERQRRIFATAVYHACLDPRRIDLPGQSRTVFSGWDVFRTEMPFLTLFFPEVVTDTVNAMMGVMESGRRDTLPVWDLFGCKSGCMIGNPLIPVILTAQEAGLGGIDYAKALDLAVKTTERRGNLACGYTPDSLSETLEYCFDDWCVSEIARRLGKDDVAARFADRARWYTNCWDRTVGWMRARTKDGGWLEPWKGATVHGQGCVESNPLQQGWFVPHDVEGLVRLVGGREKTLAKLEEFFEKAPDDFLWGDYYNHPNEPSHHIVFLFSELGRPDLTQKWTRRILEKAYNDDVRGLCGNDDVGQMSAWYVLSALGFYPLDPVSGEYVIGSPLVRRATLRIGAPYKPAVFTVVARNQSKENALVRSVKLNGVELVGNRTAADLGLAAASEIPPAPVDPETATDDDEGIAADAKKTRDYVEYMVGTNTARFQGEFAKSADIPTAADGYRDGPPTNNDYIVVRDMSDRETTGDVFTSEGSQTGSINANGIVDPTSTGFRYTAAIPVEGFFHDRRGNEFEAVHDRFDRMTRIYPRQIVSIPRLAGCADFYDLRRADWKAPETTAFNFDGSWE